MGVLKAGDEDGMGFGSADLMALREGGAERVCAKAFCLFIASMSIASTSIVHAAFKRNRYIYDASPIKRGRVGVLRNKPASERKPSLSLQSFIITVIEFEPLLYLFSFF